MTFGFEIRFLTPAGRTFNGVGIDNHFPLTFPDVLGKVSLQHLPRRPNDIPSSPERFLIKGSGFSTEDAARAFGQRLKQAISVIGCETGLGIDVGRDRVTSSFASSIKVSVREQQGLQLRDIVHGLDVFPEDPSVIRAELSMAASVIHTLEGFPEKVASEVVTIKPLPPKLCLALELYNLAQFEPASKTRFLNLVTIVEVLANREPRAKCIRVQIDELMRSVRASKLSEEVAVHGVG